MEIKRVAAVTGGLVVAGAVAGGIAAALAVVVAGQLQAAAAPDPYVDPYVDAGIGISQLDLLIICGGVGAVYGAVLGPLAAWLLMRHVPVGVAMGGTMLGTLAGGVAVLAFDGSGLLPFAGFALSALAIRIAVPRRIGVEG